MPYFDCNATTPLHPAALAAWREAAERAWHNPSSPYRAAARAHALLEDARERLAGIIGGGARDYIFTSGATEANNAVFAHLARTAPSGARVVVSAIEHPCVMEAARAWFAGRIEYLPCDKHGVTDIAGLQNMLKRGGVALISLMAANNETGALQPWREARELCREHGVPFHCDAVQWMGKLPPGDLGTCDFLTGSAHKFGGPKGVGFLKASAPALRVQFGGEQEHGRRAGTENLPGIAGMVAALEALGTITDAQTDERRKARDDFELFLVGALPGAQIAGARAVRLWNTTMFIPPRHANMRWVAALDRRGCEISTGSACATGHEGPSHVLAAMGVAPDTARRALRVSAGWGTGAADWAALRNALAGAAAELDKEPAISLP